MATIQAKVSRGHKYWYIVESRRVNKKPRPVVLEYLGKADDLLKRLHGLKEDLQLKSYSHGAIAALLQIANQLDICRIINRYIDSSKEYIAQKPLRHNLTAGVSFLLAAIGRVCMPTSKRGWCDWAKTTSLAYLLRCSLSKVDSQHFWDLMDSLPVAAIPKIETAILQNVWHTFQLEHDTLFFDTTNFFTYIDSANDRCTIAERGKNKQKRTDLRQVGLAMVVTRRDMIPLFHLTYEGNRNDSKVFRSIIGKIRRRLKELGFDLAGHTLVFDRGNNSKTNLKLVQRLKMYYVGALTPYQHQQLLNDALDYFQTAKPEADQRLVFRDKRMIWGAERTVVVFISEQLKTGQIRGWYQALAKVEQTFKKIQAALAGPQAKKRDRVKLEVQISGILRKQHATNLMKWSLKEVEPGKLALTFEVDEEALVELEEHLGVRIIMTNRHDWETSDITNAYHGQSAIEQAFRNIENPMHLALGPQFHWTDQKIKVHYFICVLGYLLVALIFRQAKLKAKYRGCLDSLLDLLNNIRLGTILEKPNGRGKPKAIYKLEQMDMAEALLLDALGIAEFHKSRPKIKGVSVYD